MVNLEYYRVFYHVAKLGSVSQAAEALYISQPAVSYTIKSLESELGGTLFYRTPNGVRLTPEGQVLYDRVAQGYEYFMQAESSYKALFSLEAGELRIGASDMTLRFFLLPYLERFNAAYPKVKISVTNGPTPVTLEDLRRGRIDFGIVSAPIDETEALDITPVDEIQDIFIAGPRFWQLKGRVLDIAELLCFPMICLEKNTSTRKYIDGIFTLNNARLVPEFELATSDLIVQFTLRGLGIGCVVRDFAEAQLEAGELFELPLSVPVPPRAVCIVKDKKIPLSPAASKLLEMMI
jgi:DNA-binding transcriptional LysR family regulator